jgi:chitinase
MTPKLAAGASVQDDHGLMQLAKTVSLFLIFLAMSLCSAAVYAESGAGRMFAVYFESWISETHNGLDNDLVNVPKSVTHLMLAFMSPDAQYAGNFQLAGTGLDFNYSGSVLRDSIRALRARNPNIKIFVSVGGEDHPNWDELNASRVAHFVRDFGIDGVDIDFEPSNPGCVQTELSISCRTDKLLRDSVSKLRASLPRSVEISLTCGATSAFGEGRWRDSGPKGGPSYGVMVRFFHSPRAKDINFLNIMAYDAGRNYNPLEALEAFRHYYGGPVLMGLSPPPEAWGDHSYSTREVATLLKAAIAKGATGAMLFSLRKGTGPDVFTPLVTVISGLLQRSRR